MRVIIGARMKEEGCDDGDGIAIQPPNHVGVPAAYVDLADYNCCLARPPEPALCRVNRSIVLTDPPQTSRASISLADGICRDQTKATHRTKHPKCSPKEVGHQVGVSVRRLVEAQKPVEQYWISGIAKRLFQNTGIGR